MHLGAFLRQRSYGSYEEWISELHPENVRSSTRAGERVIDDRFYIEGSDHRRLWNSRVESHRQVAARRMGRRSATRPEASHGRSNTGCAGYTSNVAWGVRCAGIGAPLLRLMAPTPLLAPAGVPQLKPSLAAWPLAAPFTMVSPMASPLPARSRHAPPVVPRFGLAPAAPMAAPPSTTAFPLAAPRWGSGHHSRSQASVPTSLAVTDAAPPTPQRLRVPPSFAQCGCCSPAGSRQPSYAPPPLLRASLAGSPSCVLPTQGATNYFAPAAAVTPMSSAAVRSGSFHVGYAAPVAQDLDNTRRSLTPVHGTRWVTAFDNTPDIRPTMMTTTTITAVPLRNVGGVSGSGVSGASSGDLGTVQAAAAVEHVPQRMQCQVLQPQAYQPRLSVQGARDQHGEISMVGRSSGGEPSIGGCPGPPVSGGTVPPTTTIATIGWDGSTGDAGSGGPVPVRSGGTTGAVVPVRWTPTLAWGTAARGVPPGSRRSIPNRVRRSAPSASPTPSPSPVFSPALSPVPVRRALPTRTLSQAQLWEPSVFSSTLQAPQASRLPSTLQSPQIASALPLC